MKIRIAIAAVILAGASLPGFAGREDPLQVYLPRTRIVSESRLTLGAIGVIRGGDTAARAKVAAISMGRSPFSSEAMVIDRRTVLGRLASSGLTANKIRLTGARQVTITRNEELFPSKKLLAAARDYLTRNRPGPEGSGWRLVRKVPDLVVPATENTDLKVRQLPDKTKGYVKLEVSAVSESKKLGSREILFKVTYPHRFAVTKKAIRAGEAVTSDNAELRTENRDYPPDAGWMPPFGMHVWRDLRPGMLLKDSLLRPKQAQLIVRRNQLVTMIVRGQGFRIVCKGQALQEGRSGDFIRVRNIDSKRIVVAKVCYDGTVEPTVKR